MNDGFGSPWRAHGGVLAAGPAITAAKNGNITTVLEIVTGTDNALYTRRADGTDNWHRLSNQHTFCKGAPGAAVYLNASGGQEIVVACRGSDDALWYGKAAQGTNIPLVNNWRTLGGRLEAGPAVGIVNGKLTFLVTGEGGRVWLNDTETGAYSARPWICIGKPALGGKPQAQLGTNSGTSYFGCHGTDHALWWARNVSGTWGAASSRGGVLRDGVAAAVSTEQVVFFVRGSDDGVWQTTVYNGNFAPRGFSANVPSKITFDPGATALT
jgi:hypothetical protein